MSQVSRALLTVVLVSWTLLPSSGSAQPESATAVLLAPVTGWIAVPADHRAPRATPPRQLYFERLGGPRRSGKKPAILLHGGPGVAPPMFRILQGSASGQMLIQYFDILYVHQRGGGKSLLPEEAKLDYVIKHQQRYAMEQYVADIEVIRQKVFGPRSKVTLVGSSWGGFLGLAYALRHQARVETLILGSFEATGAMGARFCPNVDQSLLAAEADFPGLRPALQALRAALQARKITWRRGKREQRTLGAADIIEVALPLATKARYRQLVDLLPRLINGETEAQAFLDRLELNETTSAGGSLPATASLCQELMSKVQLETALADPPAALYADCRQVARSLQRLCAPFLSNKRPFDVEGQLPRLKVPALIFAGRWDPLLPWTATARTAAKMPNATFLLIKGGHTPFDEGGACLARIIERLATERYDYDLSCL